MDFRWFGLWSTSTRQSIFFGYIFHFFIDLIIYKTLFIEKVFKRYKFTSVFYFYINNNKSNLSPCKSCLLSACNCCFLSTCL